MHRYRSRHHSRHHRPGIGILQVMRRRLLGIFPVWETIAIGPADRMQRIAEEMNSPEVRP